MDATLAEALDIVVGRTGHTRFRELCDPGHPDHDPAYIRTVLAMAGKPAPEPAPAPQLPSLLTRVANFASAVVSHVAAGLPTLDDDHVAARLAVCSGCDQRLPGGVCAGCGCHLATKARWAGEQCPRGLWPAPPDAGSPHRL